MIFDIKLRNSSLTLGGASRGGEILTVGGRKVEGGEGEICGCEVGTCGGWIFGGTTLGSLDPQYMQ